MQIAAPGIRGEYIQHSREVTTAMPPPPEIRATTVWSSNAQNRSIIAGFIGCFELASVLSKSKPNTLALEQTLSKSSSDHERTTICRASLVDECSQPMNQS